MDMKYNSSKSKRLALGAILLVFTVIVLSLIPVIPVNTLSLYALSSFFTAVVIIELSIRYSWIYYVASCLLALIIVPDKISVIPYAVFFGLYGILKYYIEILRLLIVEVILKLLCFNGFLAGAFYIFGRFAAERLKVEFSWWILILGFNIAFLIYDYVYTLFIRYYTNKLRALMKF